MTSYIQSITLGSLSKGRFSWVSFLRLFKKITRNVSSETGEVNGLFNNVPFVQAQRPESGFPACIDTCIMAYVCNHSAGGQGTWVPIDSYISRTCGLRVQEEYTEN